MVLEVSENLKQVWEGNNESVDVLPTVLLGLRTSFESKTHSCGDGVWDYVTTS